MYNKVIEVHKVQAFNVILCYLAYNKFTPVIKTKSKKNIIMKPNNISCKLYILHNI